MHPLLEKQNKLHREATVLIQEQLLPLLKKYGGVVVGGSYVYNLLSKPDIDIDIVSEEATLSTYEELCTEIQQLERVVGFKTTNRSDRPLNNPEGRPTGYWLGPQITFNDVTWNIDIWLQKPEWHTGNTLKYKESMSMLSDEDRIVILSLKEQLLSENLYGIGKEFLSVDVYEGVLHHYVKTVEDLRQHKLRTN